ncbi:MAG: tetratricopeptide repeat protein [Acidobacteria bacterium]|nr:tetratricopeptide repeat protein [Acidobacteriota bacterium]
MDKKANYYLKKYEEHYKLIDTKPKADVIGFLETVIQEAEDKGDDAYALFFKGRKNWMLGNFKEAARLKGKAADKLPNVAFVLIGYAVSLAYINDEENAIKFADIAYKLEPDSALINWKNGVVSYKLRKPSEAILALDKALKLDPDNIHALGKKGDVLHELNKFDEASAVYKKALNHAPKSVPLLNNLGVVLRHANKHTEAIEILKLSNEIDPTIIDTIVNLGATYDDLGKYYLALDYYNKALEINSECLTAIINKGITLSNLVKYEEAIRMYNKALEINPEEINALVSKGDALYKLGKYNQAIKLYSKALEINPKEISALVNKGRTLIDLGEHHEAIKLYDKVLKIEPQNKYALYGLVDCYIAIKDFKKAKKIDKELKKILDDDNESTIWLDYKMSELPSEKTSINPEIQKLDYYMRKVLEDFNDKKMTIYTGTIETAKNKFNSVIKKYDNSDKFKETEPKNGFLSILRRWNSYTPILNIADSKGGGYFMKIGGKGIVVDPGIDFMRNFFGEGFLFYDIDMVFITHAHPDHMADLESIFSLLHEINEDLPDGKKKTIDLYMNLGTMKKVSGWLNPREDYLRKIHVVEEGIEYPLTNILSVLPTKAIHCEILAKNYALGYIFKLRGRKIIGFTGDTAWAQDGSIAEPYKKCDILVAHLGSIYEKDFKGELHSNHLGLLGLSGLIGAVKPKLCVISEFGEELETFREELANNLTKNLGPTCISADIGTEVGFTDPPTIRCIICGEFVKNYFSDNMEGCVFYKCNTCKEEYDSTDNTKKYINGTIYPKKTLREF